MKELLEKLDYKNVLYYFTQISNVPRGSGHNDKISDFLVEFAKEQGLFFVQDTAKNIVIYKPATTGYEEHTPVIIQGHMDMVCVADEGVQHDFQNEGLELFVDKDWICARGTTLGGDDGIAVAYGMALLADHTISHPALEVVITTDEETGMYGAKALDPSLLHGRYLINVDSEDEGIVLAGCAGGVKVTGTLPFRMTENSGTLIELELKGLLGGHSGAEINKYRVNAVYEMARILFDLKKQEKYLLADLNGGEKDNAIPNTASAKILVPDQSVEKIKEAVFEIFEIHKKELSGREPGIKLEICEKKVDSVFAADDFWMERLLFVLLQAPDGVQKMSSDIDGLVESSLNLGIFKIKKDPDRSADHLFCSKEEKPDSKQESYCAEFHFSVRSSISSYKHFLCDKLKFLFQFFCGEYKEDGEYPAWEYRKDSPLRKEFIQVFEKVYGRKPQIQAIHAGLECGLISEKIPEMDIVSIGPDMKDIHTAKERLCISSSIRVYKFLEELLQSMKCEKRPADQ